MSFRVCVISSIAAARPRFAALPWKVHHVATRWVTSTNAAGRQQLKADYSPPNTVVMLWTCIVHATQLVSEV